MCLHKSSQKHKSRHQQPDQQQTSKLRLTLHSHTLLLHGPVLAISLIRAELITACTNIIALDLQILDKRPRRSMQGLLHASLDAVDVQLVLLAELKAPGCQLRGGLAGGDRHFPVAAVGLPAVPVADPAVVGVVVIAEMGEEIREVEAAETTWVGEEAVREVFIVGCPVGVAVP
jgi:hypothetical protein